MSRLHNEQSIGTYLYHHLAGSHFAAQLLSTLQQRHKDDELGSMAADLRIEVQQDQETLQGIVDEVGEAI
jgi:hypothetical protein